MLLRVKRISFGILFAVFISTCEAEVVSFQKLASSDGLTGVNAKWVEKDINGLMIFVTVDGIFQYDGFNLKKHPILKAVKGIDITAFAKDPNSQFLWMGTAKDGVLYFDGTKIHRLELTSKKRLNFLQKIWFDDDDIWLVFKQKIIVLNNKKESQTILHPFLSKVSSIAKTSAGALLFSTKQSIYSYDRINNKFMPVKIQSSVVDNLKQVLHRDVYGVVWLGRGDGVYQFHPKCMCFSLHPIGPEPKVITALESDSESLWIGTIQTGLYRYNFKNHKTHHYLHSQLDSESISDNSIMNLKKFGDVLWISTFYGGISYVNLHANKFGKFNSNSAVLNCVDSTATYGFYEQNDLLWIGTNNGLVKANLKADDCRLIDSGVSKNGLSSPFVYSIEALDETIWLTTGQGLNKLDIESNSVVHLQNAVSDFGVHFLSSPEEGMSWLGTSRGIYQFFPDDESLVKVASPIAPDGKHILFLRYAKTKNGQVVFGTNYGLFVWDKKELKTINAIYDMDFTMVDISGLTSTADGGFLVAADRKYFLKFNADHTINDYSALFTQFSDVSIYKIFSNDASEYWLSSDRGIIYFNEENLIVKLFGSSDGVISSGFLNNSGHIGKSGFFYFGGIDGFNRFDPDQIDLNTRPPHANILNISQFSESLSVGSKTIGGYEIKKPVFSLERIQLNHKDIVLSLEFGGDDFLAPEKQKFGYRLVGLSDQWNYVDANNRNITFSNFRPGKYTFQVKVQNSHGDWSIKPKSLNIDVKPAPWFSVWAYTAYVLLLIASIIWFIRYKTTQARKRASELESMVTERTQEVALQKKMMESLLEHKNQLFANVTHEFKTPLTLMLGPIEQINQTVEAEENKNNIHIIKKNAKRLLLMVAQILKLSEVENHQTVIKEPQNVHATLLMLFESFKVLADEKDIELKLQHTDSVSILATRECLEMVVGNLLSNALKFTSRGGAVSVQSHVYDGRVAIRVEDTGCGIQKQDFTRVFQRFARLENPQSVQGTGIGLAVVKEVTEANLGMVSLVSEWGKGSVFTVDFPIYDDKVSKKTESDLSSIMVENTEAEISSHKPLVQRKLGDDALKILIIEDNADMQTHIHSILCNDYECLLANLGKEGVGIALSELPDIVVCDVMMPGMDGYQVTRILRNDERTSHIPIILLTALNTKESRIKGWRENIDRYMAKPFDATELKANILSIIQVRRLLQQKTNLQIKECDSLEMLDLSLQDIKFLEKLQTIINKNYHNPSFHRPQIADLMALSESQLQRKVKALTGQRVMDILRTHRLKQACLKLKEGLQVGVVSDACGFNEVSYFSSSFKKIYGLTPKKYQQLKKS